MAGIGEIPASVTERNLPLAIQMPTFRTIGDIRGFPALTEAPLDETALR
jgi:hypothetical protein